MQNADLTGRQPRTTSIAVARQARGSDGRVETAIVSVAGLAVTLALMAHNLGAFAAQLFAGP